MTNKKEIRNIFDTLNSRFFGNRLSSKWDVRFVHNLKSTYRKKWIRIDGLCRYETMEIFIDKSLAKHADAAVITLIHEMAHADLMEYVGYDSDEKHGMRFQAKIVELFNLGAYDGLL